MPIGVFQTIAETLKNDLYALSPVGKSTDGALLQAINSDQKYPDITDIAGIKDIIGAIAGNDGSDDLKKLVDFSKMATPLDFLKALWGAVEDLPGIVEGFLAHQVEVAASILSFVDIADDKPPLLDALKNAYGDYFFAGGYNTVPSQKISPPSLPSDSATPKDVASFFTQKTGERYVRDLVRVGIESMGNTLWKLDKSYAAIDTAASVTNKAKAKQWFAGFSDYAESATTAAVEQAVQGISEFQTNPMIAAAVATSAGTAARKAAQRTFFLELGIGA